MTYKEIKWFYRLPDLTDKQIVELIKNANSFLVFNAREIVASVKHMKSEELSNKQIFKYLIYDYEYDASEVSKILKTYKEMSDVD